MWKYIYLVNLFRDTIVSFLMRPTLVFSAHVFLCTIEKYSWVYFLWFFFFDIIYEIEHNKRNTD